MKKGISLIVLVITIIVIIILAGAVVLSLSKNNPITAATEATFKANLSGYNNELSMYISSEYTNGLGNFDITNINTSTNNEIKQYIKGISDIDISKYRIVKGKLAYIGSDLNEIQWAKDLNTSLDLPYINDGLVLWYDGIYNGGIGVHNDNNSLNKTKWFDLSGNNNEGVLDNFDFTTSNGWGDSFLNYGLPTSNVMPSQKLTYSTVQIVYETKAAGWNYIIDARTDITDGWAAICSALGGAYLSPYKDGITDTTLGVLPTNRKTYISIKTNPTANVMPTIGARYTKNESLMGKIYCIRIYNRLLTEQEIAYNYEIDKIRY